MAWLAEASCHQVAEAETSKENLNEGGVENGCERPHQARWHFSDWYELGSYFQRQRRLDATWMHWAKQCLTPREHLYT